MDIVYNCGNIQFGAKIDELAGEKELTDFLSKIHNAATKLRIKDEISQHKLDIFLNEQNIYTEEKNLGEFTAHIRSQEKEFHELGGHGKRLMTGQEKTQHEKLTRGIETCRENIENKKKRIAFLEKLLSG